MKFIFLLPLFIIACTAPPVAERAEKLDIHVIQPDLSMYYSLSHITKTKSEEKKVKTWAYEIDKNHCQKNSLTCAYIKKTYKQKEPNIKINWQKIGKMDFKSYDQYFRAIKKTKPKEVSKHLEKVKNLNCNPQFNLAVARSMEERDEGDVLEVLNPILSCPINRKFEEQYLRAVLIFKLKGEEEKAKELIKKLVEAPEKEVARILFWASILLKENKYAQELIEKRPYTWQAVLAANNLNRSLWEEISKKKDFLIQRPDHEIVELYEKLLAYGYDEEAFEVFNENLEQEMFKESLGSVLYFLKLMKLHGRADYVSRLSSKILQIYPSLTGRQIVEITYEQKYMDLFQEHAPDMDPYLLLSLSKQESGFYEKATSHARAKGLMQLLPSTAKMISKKHARDLYNVDNNVFLGSTYFRGLVQKFNSVELSLAAYNAGPHRIDKWKETYKTEDLILFLELIPFKETRIYVSSILRNNYFYHNFYNAKNLKDKEIKSFLVEQLFSKN